MASRKETPVARKASPEKQSSPPAAKRKSGKRVGVSSSAKLAKKLPRKRQQGDPEPPKGKQPSASQVDEKPTLPKPKSQSNKEPSKKTQPPKVEKKKILKGKLKPGRRSPEFEDQEGDYYLGPSFDLPGGKMPDGHHLPESIPCEGSLVIFASWAAWVTDCKDYSGPNAGNNQIVKEAEKIARRYAERIPCKAPCRKSIELIWKAWRCDPQDGRLLAVANVQLEVRCTRRNEVHA
jgi:hypothetical protein